MTDENVIEESAEMEKELRLPVRPIEQSLRWDCGPTALRILVKYLYGLKLTAREVVLITGATEGGTDEYNLMNGLDVLGLKYTQSERGTFNKLKKHLQAGQPSIIHVLCTDGGGHYVVFSGYDENNVYLADPSNGKIVKYGIPFFLGIWKVEEGETQTRFYLTITGRIEDKITSVIQRLKRIQKKSQHSRK